MRSATFQVSAHSGGEAVISAARAMVIGRFAPARAVRTARALARASMRWVAA